MIHLELTWVLWVVLYKAEHDVDHRDHVFQAGLLVGELLLLQFLLLALFSDFQHVGRLAALILTAPCFAHILLEKSEIDSFERSKMLC